MRFVSCLLILATISFTSFSQTDTTYLYFNKNWKACHKDTAYYKGIIYKHDNVWHRKDFWVKENQIQMDETTIDPERKKRHGLCKWFYENGQIESTATYNNGIVQNREAFYDNGNKKARIDFVDGEIVKETGWDISGNEIPNYIFEKEAKFPGGLENWRRYLENNLDAAIAARSNARPGVYHVKVQFIVDKEGNISNVNAIKVPDDCKKCGKEAIRVIVKGPKWEPAIQFGKPVIYQAIQDIYFQVSNE